jgi:hypothetical protein
VGCCGVVGRLSRLFNVVFFFDSDRAFNRLGTLSSTTVPFAGLKEMFFFEQPPFYESVMGFCWARLACCCFLFVLLFFVRGL